LGFLKGMGHGKRLNGFGFSEIGFKISLKGEGYGEILHAGGQERRCHAAAEHVSGMKSGEDVKDVA